MPAPASENDLLTLIKLLGRLPGIGQRSARRIALHLLKKRDALMLPLARALSATAQNIRNCSECGNWDTQDPCNICAHPSRDKTSVCVVEDVADLWAMERSNAFRGVYHVLGGTLSALDGVTPNDLNIPVLLERCKQEGVLEVILAMNATVEGQITAHYVSQRLHDLPLKITRLAHGVPLGGELDFLDEGTLTTALMARLAL
jgi:recombination protein RecR